MMTRPLRMREKGWRRREDDGGCVEHIRQIDAIARVEGVNGPSETEFKAEAQAHGLRHLQLLFLHRRLLLLFLHFDNRLSSRGSNQTRLRRRNQTLRQLSRKRNTLAVREQNVGHDHELGEVQLTVLVQVRHSEQLLQHRTRKTTLTVITDHQVVGNSALFILILEITQINGRIYKLYEELLIESSLLRRGGKRILILALWLI